MDNIIYIHINEHGYNVNCQTGEVYSESDILESISLGIGIIYFPSFEDYLEEIKE